MQKVTATEYNKMVKKISPNSNTLKNSTQAFIIGGAICCLGQFIKNIYISLSVPETDAGVLMSVTLIALAVIATACNVYDNLANLGGAGTLVPITGFANAVCSPALEFKAEGFVLGLSAKMFIIAGPVIVYGVTASVIYGVIFFLMRL